MRNRLAALVMIGVLAATAAAADVVHFKTGRSIEGVIAEETETHVRIRLAFGEITVPRDAVERIERVASPLEVYLKRKQELVDDPEEATAEDWLALARWARGQDLGHSAREAVLRAADLDPKLEGLEPILTAFDYVFDEESGRWLSFDESMWRQGYVRHLGSWISREELAEMERQRRAEAEARREARRALALQAERERRIAEDAARRALAHQAYAAWWGYAPFGFHAPFVGVPAFVVPPFLHAPRVGEPKRPDRSDRRHRFEGPRRGDPPPPAHRGGISSEQIERAPGSLRTIDMEPHRPGSLRPPAPLGERP